MKRLISALALPLAMAVAVDARAQAQPVNVCAPVERELQESRKQLEAAQRRLSEAERALVVAKETEQQLEATRSKLNEVQGAAESCEAQRQNLCSAAGAFASGLANGTVEVGGLAACVSSEHQRSLSEQLSGWRNATQALTQLGAYSAGESDLVPALGPIAGTQAEKILSRLLSSGQPRTPLFYRRLLVEALELCAPQTWKRIRSGGPAAIEAWFAGKGPLDPEIIAEAQHDVDVQSTTSPLSTALQLVHSYQRLARCYEEQPGKGACARAAQLRQVLESSGPLLIRRRTQDIWSTDCTDLNPSTLLQWTRLLPASGHRPRSEGEPEVTEAAASKLYSCFLRDAAAGSSFTGWLAPLMPAAKSITAYELRQLDAIRATWVEGGPEDLCARAVRAMQTVPTPSACELAPDALAAIEAWSVRASAANGADANLRVQMCGRLAVALWEGRAATVAPTFPSTPTIDDVITTRAGAPPTSMERLRDLCDNRQGSGAAFAKGVQDLARLARGFGESPGRGPWRIDPVADQPIEASQFAAAQKLEPWLARMLGRTTACSALDLDPARCDQCRGLPPDEHYDCTLLAQLEETWDRRTHRLIAGVVSGVILFVIAVWAARLRRAVRDFGAWSKRAQKYLAGIGVSARPDAWRWLFPSRFQILLADLPSAPAWERWGRRAAVLRAPHGPRFHERDVNRAAVTAHQIGAEIVLLVHDEQASPDLAAIRAILEWAAKGGTRAVHVLPISWERLQWSRGADDLLDLVEEMSLRSNPFEVRGRIQSSSQFFNRERLVSGLLASAQAGHWTLVTGLRRFGKSSLALEVARRLPGPSAYVDLAGFHDEFGFSQDPARAADAILRYLCLQLHDSARVRFPRAELPEPPGAGAVLDATTLALWFRHFTAAITEASANRSPPVLLILDELEQAIGVGADRLGHALDVLAILVGRLRNSLSGASFSQGQSRVGILLCSALHPLLWAPLGTLAHQSLIGTFESVCVPCLPEEAASAMMRSLGARHGIRFTDAALEYIVRQAQGIPLLVRRIGSAVLELYDPERARQGSLGAVEIGIEGATTAVEREEEEGSPLRVWVESEIAEVNSPAGAVLRRLALVERCATLELRELATRVILARFAVTGVDRTLPGDETRRRAQEAAGLLLRLLGESGLLVTHGDLTSPEAYELPDGVVRRILRRHSGVSEPGVEVGRGGAPVMHAPPAATASPNARPEP